MLNSLGKELSKEDFLVSALGNQHAFVVIQASNTNKPLVVRWSDLLKAVVSNINLPTGSAAWGSIGSGTGVGSQTDLVAYLTSNFYPLLSNPAGYVTASTLAATLLNYVTNSALAAILGGYVPTSRTLTINGTSFDLSADRTWTIPGGGTVTSVAATVPSPSNPALSVAVTNPSTTPSVNITANGNTSQLILGNGSLASINQVVVAARVYQEDTYVSNVQQTSVEYVAGVGKVYVTNQSSTNVTIYDATNGDLLATIAGITNALKAKYISSINEVWVTSSTATTIWRIGAVSNTLLGTITTGVTQFGYDILEYSATKVFITCNLNPGSIMVVNPSTLSVTTTITTNVPVLPGGMALNTNVSSLQFDKIVVCSSGGVSILDPNTNAISTTVANPGSVFSTGRFIRYSPSDDKYYAASRANNRLVVLSIATATTFTATFNSNNLFLMDCAVDDANDLLFTFPMEGGAVESILVKVYQKSTLTPIVAFKTSCLGGQSSESGFHAIDLLNKRLFVVGRNAQANGAVSVIRYL